MYTVNEMDKGVELADIPQSTKGIVSPLVVANQGTVVLAYYTSSELVHMFGPPNDEAFEGPLVSLGLTAHFEPSIQWRNC